LAGSAVTPVRDPGLTFVTPAFETLQGSIVAIGLPASNSANLWGPSMDVPL
jgi:hypothetical protein